MNAVAFSLWNSDPKYCVGAVRNAELIKSVYPGWEMVVFADRSVPEETTLQLSKLGVKLKKPQCENKMFWRFFIADTPGVERFLIRDTDSRLNEREAGAVAEWIEGGKKAHVIADHPGHRPVIGGGLFGAVKGAIPNMAELIKSCSASAMTGERDSIYNTDQIFLRDKVWPLIKHDCLIHDFCYHRMRVGAKPFSAKFGEERFVGEVFGADDVPRSFDASMRLSWMAP